ncbi:NADPH-dependent FMN reductase [Methanococcus maripaludis C5]|uniref:NADPH-dependent FMN reductase n=1 Tax=Methanococcus maripaludis (strain C5 / ATCC BAA-1333) TaxID=402880 RepID=A4FZ06_METM5|nr:flavodoxin family protein [Methanococcus maripaludis]ABO35440.1 NADPH-dependent FMN reductase [Methanococcus maripaludis C5]
MKIIAVSGSPRVSGNTNEVIDKIIEGATSKGAEIKFYNLNKMNIRGCQGCMKCRGEYGCSINDDLQEIYRELPETDVLILGSPIYMWQVTSQMKMFLDRLFPVMASDYSPRLKNIKTITVYVQGNPDKNRFSPYFEHNNKMLDFLGLNVTNTLIAAGFYAPGEVSQNEEIMNEALNLGININ